MALPLLKVSFVMNVIAVIWVINALVLVLVILIQKGKGGGLSAAFGGGMGGGILGTKTGDFLTWLTIVMVGAFLLLSIVLAKFYKPISGQYDTSAEPVRQVQPIEQAESQGEPAGKMEIPIEE